MFVDFLGWFFESYFRLFAAIPALGFDTTVCWARRSCTIPTVLAGHGVAGAYAVADVGGLYVCVSPCNEAEVVRFG